VEDKLIATFRLIGSSCNAFRWSNARVWSCRRKFLSYYINIETQVSQIVNDSNWEYWVALIPMRVASSHCVWCFAKNPAFYF